jgi:hypothetical protein
MYKDALAEDTSLRGGAVPVLIAVLSTRALAWWQDMQTWAFRETRQQPGVMWRCQRGLRAGFLVLLYSAEALRYSSRELGY